MGLRCSDSLWGAGWRWLPELIAASGPTSSPSAEQRKEARGAEELCPQGSQSLGPAAFPASLLRGHSTRCSHRLLSLPHPYPLSTPSLDPVGEFPFDFHLCILFFFFKDCIYLFLERRREVEREGEKHRCVRETLIGCLSFAPTWGPGPQPRHVS